MDSTQRFQELVSVPGISGVPTLRIYFAAGMFPGRLGESNNLDGYEFKPVAPTNGLPYMVCRGKQVPADVAADVDLLFDLVQHHAHLYRIDLSTGEATMARCSSQVDAVARVAAPRQLVVSPGLLAMLRSGWAEKCAQLGLCESAAGELEASPNTHVLRARRLKG